MSRVALGSNAIFCGSLGARWFFPLLQSIYMGNVARALSSFPLFPGSAAGAAALKSGRRPRARVLAGGLRW